jgi:ABC-type transporter Mla subunit MlaD
MRAFMLYAWALSWICRRLAARARHCTACSPKPAARPCLAVYFMRNMAANMRIIAPDMRNIAANMRNIAANMRNIAANSRNITANMRNITANMRNIAANMRNIAANMRNITANMRNIAANMRNIAANMRNNAAMLRIISQGAKHVNVKIRSCSKKVFPYPTRPGMLPAWLSTIGASPGTGGCG